MRLDGKQSSEGTEKGSEEALEWFIDHYSSYVTTIIYNIIGAFMDEADIEEVVSDVFFT